MPTTMYTKTLSNLSAEIKVRAVIAAFAALLLFVASGALIAHAQTQAEMQAQIQLYTQQLAQLQSQLQSQAQVSGTYAFKGNLGIGSRGASVIELQRFLATDSTIYPEGLITGYYGTLTARAVQRFQCRHGIVCSGSVSTTGYGRVGPGTLAKLFAIAGLTGIGGPSVDIFAPIMSVETVSTSSNSATISWVTNEPTRSRVLYSTTFPFFYDTAASVSDATAFDLNQTVTVPNLLSNTTYFYVRESVDASGNVQLTTAKTFRTGP